MRAQVIDFDHRGFSELALHSQAPFLGAAGAVVGGKRLSREGRRGRSGEDGGSRHRRGEAIGGGDLAEEWNAETGSADAHGHGRIAVENSISTAHNGLVVGGGVRKSETRRPVVGVCFGASLDS